MTSQLVVRHDQKEGSLLPWELWLNRAEERVTRADRRDVPSLSELSVCSRSVEKSESSVPSELLPAFLCNIIDPDISTEAFTLLICINTRNKMIDDAKNNNFKPKKEFCNQLSFIQSIYVEQPTNNVPLLNKWRSESCFIKTNLILKQFHLEVSENGNKIIQLKKVWLTLPCIYRKSNQGNKNVSARPHLTEGSSKSP